MASKVVLKGSLEFIELGELLQQLGTSGSTGTVKLTCGGIQQPGYIYVVDGNPVNAQHGDVRGVDALYGFFGWTKADFEFIKESVTCETVIRKGRMEIILDGLRMMDDGLIPVITPRSEPLESGEENHKKKSAQKKDLPVINGPIIDYVYVVDEEEFTDGTDVVAQDKFGNWFWVILSGRLEVIRVLPEGSAPIVQLADGAYIGSIVSFLREGNVRSATVKAIGQVQLGVLDSEMISREYAMMTDDLQNILISIDKRLRQVTELCARIVLNCNAPPTAAFRKIKPLICQNRNEDKCFRIKSGKAYVVRNTQAGDIHLCTLTQGDFVGAIPFLNTSHEPYSANIFASKDLRVEQFDLSQVRKEYASLSQTFKNMIKYMSTSISVTSGRVIDLAKERNGKGKGKGKEQGAGE